MNYWVEELDDWGLWELVMVLDSEARAIEWIYKNGGPSATYRVVDISKKPEEIVFTHSM